MLHHVELLLTTEDVSASKRKPDIYLAAAKHWNLAPNSCMVFEDAPYAGRTAKNAGFYVCGLAENFYESQQAALREISDLFIEKSFCEIMHNPCIFF